MSNKDLIVEAIKSGRSIQFEYNRQGSANGIRYADPHILYVTKNGYSHLDVFKTGGVSTDPSQRLPDWRCYDINFMSNIVILQPFTRASGYKPYSSKYSNARVIARL